jgi:uncharacterized repeat protein (TIGR01451 family)
VLLSLLLFTGLLPAIARTGVPPSAAAADAQKSPATDFVPGEILVRFRKESHAKDIERSYVNLRAEGGRVLEVRVEGFKGGELVEGLRVARVPAGDTLAAIAELNAHPDVLYAEPNYIRRSDKLPNDPKFPVLWGLKNNGGSGMPAGVDIDAEAAWDITTGSHNTVVGVIDEGIDVNHQDLKDNIWRNPGEIADNGVDDDGNGFVDDINGWDFFHNDKTVFDGTGSDDTDAHGTHVAGTIGATGDNSIGVVGVNWQVSIMSLKIVGRANEMPAQTTVLQSVQAYNYARVMRELWVSTNGARGANLRVLNNSYGGGGRSQAELDAILALGQAGILFVASAGNKGTNNDRFPHYPSSYEAPNLISVAATGRWDMLTNFSNYGQRTVTMAAPGESILSTTPGNTYSSYSGTSMSAPHVSGTAALVAAVNPNISVERLRAALIYSGEEIVSLSPTAFQPGIQTGRRLNALNALQNAVEADATPPSAAANLHITSQTGRSITLNWTAPGDDIAAGRASLYEFRYSDINPTTDAQFKSGMALTAPLPLTGGTSQSFTLKIPYMHTSGFIAVRAIDNAGNTGTVASVGVTVPLADADPYAVEERAPSALSTGGTPLGLIGDDKLRQDYGLPFYFPFYDGLKTEVPVGESSITISTNGAIYLSSPPPRDSNGNATDPISSVASLHRSGYKMIAGLWDDLRTDRRAGDDVYVVKPDADRVIFRWQAVTFDTPLGNGTTRGENPVSFEIELRRDGTIQTRYGTGNQKVLPVVGISVGDPEAYVIASHTSESEFKDLGNAQTVTFAPRIPPPPPRADIRAFIGTPTDFVTPGQLITYNLSASNGGPLTPPKVVVKFPIPAGTEFVSCTGCNQGSVFDSNGAVSVDFLYAGTFDVTLKVTAQPGATINSTVTATSEYADPYPSNNSATGRPISVLQDMVVATPTFSPDGGNFDNPVNVSISCTTPGVFIRYTTNGQEPTQNDPWLSQGFTVRVDRNLTLKAKAFKDGWTASGTKSAAFVMANPVPTPTPTVSLSSSSYNFYEGDTTGYVSILVTRAGGTSTPVSIEYVTSDSSGMAPCQTNNTGTASERCDYTTAAGTLRFGPSEMMKAIQIPVINDAYQEPNETFTISLRNPQGMSLGTFSTATVTIQSDDTQAAIQNPIDTQAIFIRQQYVDFLGRVAETDGFNFWNNRMNNCPPGQVCDRIDTSQRFFQSDEFQERGFYVYRLYDALLARLPKYAEFVPDVARLNGPQTVAEQRLGKDAYLLDFMAKQEFRNLYGAFLSGDNLTAVDAASFVNTLCQKSGITPASKQTLIDNLQNGVKDPAHTLEDFILTQEMSGTGNLYYDRGFITMQYFGYLRRDPDDGGFQFWVNQLIGPNAPHRQDYRFMVGGFLQSDEYRFRFALISNTP